MELLPSGAVNAWLYGHETTRFKGVSKSVAVPANWTPVFKAMGESGNGYLAGLYVGKAEAATTYYDGLARQIQTKTRAESQDVERQHQSLGYLAPAKVHFDQELHIESPP